MRKSIILLVLLFVGVSSLTAQNKKQKTHKVELKDRSHICDMKPFRMELNGLVSEDLMGESLIMATVQIEGTHLKTTTDYDGKFKFHLGIEHLNSKLRISYPGYEDKVIQLSRDYFERGKLLKVSLTEAEIQTVIICPLPTNKKSIDR